MEVIHLHEADDFHEMAESRVLAVSLFSIDAKVFTGIVLDGASIHEQAACACLSDVDAHVVREWARLRELSGLLKREGLSPILPGLIGERTEVDRAR